jgi:hypothetical protein
MAYFFRKPGELKAKMCEKQDVFLAFFKPQRASKKAVAFLLHHARQFSQNKSLAIRKARGIGPRSLLAGFASQIALFCIYFMP